MDALTRLSNDPRVTRRRAGPPDPDGACVVYWMQRAQRGIDNPALNVAVEAGNALGKPVVAFFAPRPFPPANLRHYAFLAQGIPDIASALEKRDVGLVLRRYPDHSLLRFCEQVRPALVVGDENPIRQAEAWRKKVARQLEVPFWTVDADVIVPSALLEKAQYSAFLMRRRLQTHLHKFLVPLANPRARMPWKPPRGVHSLSPDCDVTVGWPIDRSVQPVVGFKGGTREAQRRLQEFVARQLCRYSVERNHPENEATSRLSPYLHFGHISPVAVALAVQNAEAPQADRDAFLNQVITWRELAVNFVYFNSNYDSFESAEPWAHRTLSKHAADPRPVLYTPRQLENAETHDPLWNAAQTQMVDRGWMHNYLRMYWAKKILEWSATPAAAYRIAVALNDKCELDGRDPNGYAGIAWSIVGKFDRPWFERAIFGQIRYMSGASMGKKFDSRKYIQENLHAEAPSGLKCGAWRRKQE
ncbi:MAG TPA: deoxyribodipyrimidine photo-lyase [Terriglobales bacterium]|nr:deoxyribodipyrimidine photo-lyase [Terriglobales bacterium]